MRLLLTHSIRWRLQLWLGFLLLLILSGFCLAVLQLQRDNQLNRVDEELELRVAALSDALRAHPPFGPSVRRLPFPGPGRREFEEGFKPPPRVLGDPPPPIGESEGRRSRRELTLSPEVEGLFDPTRPEGFYFSVWSRGGNLIKGSTNTPPAIALPQRPGRDTRIRIRMLEGNREAYHFTELGDCVLVGRSILTDLAAMRRFTWLLIGAGVTVLAFGLGGGWWLTTQAIRPIEEISASAGRISAGNLSERIKVVEPPNELSRLADVLNSAFARLESSFSQQKQFTADASHELRTPLSVLITETQATLARPRTAPEYKETIENCLATAQQMRRLAESLLALARLDAEQDALKQDRFDLSAAARECVDLIRPLAAKRGIEIQCDLPTTNLLGDREAIVQVITNLLSNAIHYNRVGGQVRIAIATENDAVLLHVIDTGIGIGPEDLPHVFERFYRADKSRAQAEGRSGLGLSICEAIVESHGGRIDIQSELGAGTQFTVRVPRDPREDPSGSLP